VESDRWADGGYERAADSGDGVKTGVVNQTMYMKSEPWHGVIDMSKSYLVIGEGASSVTYKFQWDGHTCHHGKGHMMYDRG